MSSKKIIIIDNSNLSYSGQDINGEVLRGTETSLILLAEHLAPKGYHIDFCTNINQNINYKNVNYFNKNKINRNILYDLAIAVSDSNQFDLVFAKKKVLFLFRNQHCENFLRKKNLF